MTTQTNSTENQFVFERADQFKWCYLEERLKLWRVQIEKVAL